MAFLASQTLSLDLNVLDYGILAVYFALVVTIGLLAKRAIATSEDFFLSGRSLPAWVTGIAFVSANLGAIEILGDPIEARHARPHQRREAVHQQALQHRPMVDPEVR